MKLLVTGGAGFIGSAFIRRTLAGTVDSVVNLDKLTYAGNLASLASVTGNPRYVFKQGDIGDRALVAELLRTHRPDAILHFAAESHVDRSIDAPGGFLQTNVVGTGVLLEEATAYWRSLGGVAHEDFRFVQVSTDEVYGDLAPDADPFKESSPYHPSSPYSASKAAADHLVRAWHRTYGLPVLISGCSNNYGPYQYPEKLIPLMILSALEGKPLPVYGDGRQVRDWLYVYDHIDALRLVIERGRVGETYNIGANNERANIDLVTEICSLLDERAPQRRRGIARYRDLITYVEDRPGHDRRYAVDASLARSELGWAPKTDGHAGLRATVDWYLANPDWCQEVLK